jgi:hypothetical protein
MDKKIFVKNWNEKEEPFDPCSLYKWRLDWLEEKVSQHHKNPNLEISDHQYQKWWDEEEKVYQNNNRDNDKIVKMQKDLSIIVPACSNHLEFLRASLLSCHQTGYFTLLAYDNPFHNNNIKVEQRMPSAEAMMLADSLIVKHKTWGGGVGIPHAWNMFYGLKLLKSFGFEYLFNLNGDCIMERPKGLEELREMLGDNDIIACEYIPEKKYCGTMAWLCKMDIALAIWEEYLEKLYYFNIGNAERRMGEWIHHKKLKVVPVVNPDEAHFKPPGSTKATFRKVLGLRHLHAESKVRRQLKLNPIEKKYYEFGPDFSFISGHDRQTLLKYWETKDQKYLEAWWK